MLLPAITWVTFVKPTFAYTRNVVGHFLPATTSHFLCMPVSRNYEECSEHKVPWIIKIK
jgi:hypothetical protein